MGIIMTASYNFILSPKLLILSAVKINTGQVSSFVFEIVKHGFAKRREKVFCCQEFVHYFSNKLILIR